MEQYYKSLYLTRDNETDITFVRENRYGVRVWEAQTLGCRVGEMLDGDKDISFVAYYSGTLKDAIAAYHTEHYGGSIQMAVVEEMPNGIKICFYEGGKPSSYSTVTYHEDGRENIRQEFDGDFQLREYCKSVYDTARNLTTELYFFPDSFTIHKEKFDFD